MNEWAKLIERYANGRPICNCGQAYYTKFHDGMMSGSNRCDHEYLACQYGCQANQYAVKDEIAKAVLRDLK